MIPTVNIYYYVTLCNNVCQWLTELQCFFLSTPVSYTNKTEHDHMTEGYSSKNSLGGVEHHLFLDPPPIGKKLNYTHHQENLVSPPPPPPTEKIDKSWITYCQEKIFGKCIKCCCMYILYIRSVKPTSALSFVILHQCKLSAVLPFVSHCFIVHFLMYFLDRSFTCKLKTSAWKYF